MHSPDIDFGGAVVTYVGFYNPLNRFGETSDYAGRLEEAMAKFNISRIEYVNAGWGAGLVELGTSRVMSGDAGYDIWKLPSISYWPLVTNNVLFPISSVMPSAYFEAFPPDVQMLQIQTSFLGEKYALGLGEGNFNNIRIAAWNKSLFEREGLPYLDQLYLDGQWTWDVLEDLAIRATRDTTGDGEIDQYGIANLSAETLAQSNGAEMVYRDENGRVVFGWDSEAAVAAFDRYMLWNQVLGLIGGNRQDFIAGRAAVLFPQTWELGEISSQMEDEFGVLPIPMGPNAERHYYPRGGADNVFLPATVEYPEGLIALHNFLWRIDEELENREELRFGIVRNVFDFELITEMEEEWQGEGWTLEGIVGPTWDWSKPLAPALHAATTGGQSPAAAMAQAAPEIQATIDDLFNQ